MPANTPIQGFRVPVNADDPDIVDDMTQLAKGIEKRVMGVYATAAARNTAVSGQVEEGMFAYTKDTDKIWYYDGAAWVEWTPPSANKIASGSTVPTNSDPGYSNGDVFFKV
jgi:hypothetical protein